MRVALQEAHTAFHLGEVPVGCVIVDTHQRLIARAHNMVEKLQDATAHAEMLALTSAMNYFRSRYLENCTVYVTLEPCPMCAYAMHLAHIRRVVWAVSDPRWGFRQFGNLLHPKCETREGILADESHRLLQQFFQQLRE